ncbi:MAG: hypothetical protein IAA97_06670 [Spirochaetes bacterium]|uniref:Uncharacterized protein n=1 Tax=Candidatus Ornithospirochaeta stercoripullorum TaxID=2840899 RepID=A0A9D9E2C5_9SPIO|nr:hypothetical protein [Candidatus Ornithospirochaeta stercoripullorum]
MKRKLLLLLLIIPLLLNACVTQSGSMIEPKDRTASLLEALAENPTGKVKETKTEIVLPTPETVREKNASAVDNASPRKDETTEVPADEIIVEAEVSEEPEPIVSVPERSEEEQVGAVFEFTEPEVPYVPVPETPDDGNLVPVSGSVEDTEPMIYPPYIETKYMEEPMAPWMGRLMVILVVVIILFTATSAIRSAYRAPLSRVVSLAIALLITAFSWVLSYIIAGPSLLYLIYLALLLTYFLLRSKRRNRDSQ